jgi:hypothetical protein
MFANGMKYYALAVLLLAAGPAAAQAPAQPPAATPAAAQPAATKPADAKAADAAPADAKSADAEQPASIKVRAGAHKAYGRIVIDWPDRPAHSASLDGNVLTIGFEKPFESDYAAVLKHLYRYVKSVEPTGDKRSIRLTLLRPVQLRVREIDGVLAVDLVDDDEAPAAKTAAAKTESKPEAKPQPNSKEAGKNPEKPDEDAKDSAAADGKPKTPAAPAIKVPVRVAEHETYSRFAFDWPGNVDYRVTREGDKVRIRFSRPAEFDIKGAGKPRLLLEYEADIEDDASNMRLVATPYVRYRHFRSGTTVVVDLLDPPASKRRQLEKQQAEADKQDGDAPAPGGEKTGESEKPAAPDADPAARSDHDEGPVKLTPEGVARELAGDAMVDEQKAPAMEAAAPAVPQQLIPYANRLDKPLRTIALAAGENLNAEARVYEKDTVLKFQWQDEVPAAGLLRAGQLWLIFDRPANVSLRGLDPKTGVLSGQQINNAASTILRLELLDGLYPEVRRDKATWWIRLARGVGRPAQALQAAIQEGEQAQGRVFVPAKDLGRRTNLYDPEVGDEIVVVPALTSGAGVLDLRQFVDFHLLATAQGVAVRPNVDDLNVKVLPNGVEILSGSGLAISSAESRARAGGDPSTVRYKASLKEPILLFKDWRLENEEFLDKRHELQTRLAETPKAGRNSVRLELARLFLAHDLTAEALSLMTLVAGDDPGIVEDTMFRAMRGVTNLLLNRLDDAENDLRFSRLKLYPDMALWRGALLKAQGKYEAATKEFALGIGSLPLQSERIQERMLLDWATAAALGGAEGEFKAAADRLESLPQSPKVASTLAYLRGIKAEELGHEDDALDLYRRAVDEHYRPNNVLARLRQTDLQRKRGEIDSKEALLRYDRLRFAWRGGQFELDAVGRMIDLHLADKNYGAALNAMRIAVTNFPDSDFTRQVAQRMKKTFVDLFLHGDADDLHPVSALALYYDFQELTPLGASGDRMIQRLADRLADIDLLDRAAQLLNHQVRYRLKGEEKAKVGARLAVIYLLDSRASDALEALKRSRTNVELPVRLAVERRYLEARALAETSRVDEALALLEDDDSGAADLLRADIFWRNQRWADAAKTGEALLGQRWQDNRKLDAMEQTQVIQVAVSLYMAGDQTGLTRVQERYGDKIAEGPLADTFRVLTHRVDPSNVAFRKLATEIASVSELESFMTNYRDRLKKGGISALN